MLDDDLYGPIKEEPDCYACGDCGFAPNGRNCPNCCPTRLQHLWWRLTWRFRWWRIRAWWAHRGAASDGEAPF